MNDITVTLMGGSLQYGWTDQIQIHVGALKLYIMNIRKFGRQVLVKKTDYQPFVHRIPPTQWGALGFLKKGRCTKIDKEVPTAELIQAVRDLAVRFTFKPAPGDGLRVAVGNDTLYVTDDERSWEVRYNEHGVTCWSSPVGNRAAWPETTVSMSTWDRPVVPVSWIMDLVRKNVSRLVDPYAWKDRNTMLLGGKER
jgi:hypothetical protein